MYRVFVVGFFLCFLSGCAVFSGDQIPPTSLVELDGQVHKPSLSYSSKALGGLSGPEQLPEAANSIIEGEFLSVVESSNYFGRLSKNDPEADIRVDVTLTNKGNPVALIPAIITGASLYIIPSWATDEFEVIAYVERKDGLKKQYKMEDSATLVQWLPMMFAFPFNNFSVVPEVRKNMYKKVLFDMERDGFFEQNHQTAIVD